MGTSASALIKVLNETAIESIQKSVNRCVMNATQEQLIEVSNVLGDVQIGNINMKQGAAVNMLCVASTEMRAAIDAQMISDLTSALEAKGESLLPGSTSTESENEIKNIFKAKLTQELTQESIQQSLQRQGVKVGNVGGNVIIRDITMEQTLSMVATTIFTSAGYSEAVTEIANRVTASGKATSESPLLAVFDGIGNIIQKYVGLIISIIVVLGIVIVAVVYFILNTEAGGRLIERGFNVADHVVKAEFNTEPIF